MRKLDQFTETVDDLSNEVYNLPIPEAIQDMVAERLTEIIDILENQSTLRSTEWEA